MSRLAKEPFNIKNKELIQVRAAAISTIGTGPYSKLLNDLVSGVRMFDKPGKMASPKLKSTTSSSASFTWDANKVDEVKNYIVAYASKGSTDFKSEKIDKAAVSYTVQNLSLREYNFKFRAENSCGLSEFSDE